MNVDTKQGEVKFSSTKLVKKTSDDGIQEWEVRVEERSDGTADVVIIHGRQDGAKQVVRDNVAVGKNVGKKNATTPLEQAIKEAEARWTKQKERHHYGDTVEESAAARSDAPMLAETYADFSERVDWNTAFVQPKLDGHRCLARNVGGQILLFSRKGEQITTMGHIAEVLTGQLDEGETIDGELYVPGTPFEKIASAIRNSKKKGAIAPEAVQYHVYDTVSPLRFGERYSRATEKLRRLPESIIVPVKTVKIMTPDEAMEFQRNAVADGFEGAMVRWGDIGYQAGKRSKNLLKLKTFDPGTFEIVGFKEGDSTCAGMCIWVCKIPANGTSFDVLAFGTHQQKRAAFQTAAEKLGHMVNIKYFGWTTTDIPKPRFPVATSEPFVPV
jgi:DNA ligase-1